MTLGTLEAPAWKGYASQSSGSFQFDFGQFYPGLMLLKLLPVSLFNVGPTSVGHLTLLTPRAVVPTCCYRNKQNKSMQPTLGLIGKRVLFVNKGSRILIYPDDPHTLLKKKISGRIQRSGTWAVSLRSGALN